MFLSSSIVTEVFAASTMARNYTTSVEGAVVGRYGKPDRVDASQQIDHSIIC